MLRIVKAAFLTILLSFLAAGYAFAEETPTRILIISDLQITDDESSCRRFADALADMSLQDPYPDVIVINGDLTNDGQEEEWELYRSTLSDSGISIPIFATNGNHDIGRGEDDKPDDVYEQKKDLFFQYTDFCGTGDDQLEYMDFSVTVNGYHVIALGNGNGNWHQKYTETQLQWFEDELLRCTREDAGKPVLVLTHEGIPNTVSGTLSEDSGQDWGNMDPDSADRLQAIMGNFPQICFFTGHTHYTLRSSKTTTEIDGVDYFNTAAVAYLWEGEGEGDHLTGSEGYYVDLYPDHVEVQGRDFMRGSWISEACFSVSVPTELPALPGSVTIRTDPADRTLTAELTGLPEDARIVWLKDGIPVLDAFSRQLIYAQSDGCSEFSACVFAPEHYQGMLEAVSTGFERNGYPFVDVLPDRWYTDPILWAWHEEIAGGADADHFAPERPCTRAEAITMLWCACGQPEPQSTASPFADVPERRYYTAAVLWASEHGIVYGTDPAHFAPEEPVSRGAFIGFLYRTLNRSAVVDPEPAFRDVLPSNPYFKAVRWAADCQISAGDANGLFHPDALCSRAEAVSFLYRAFAIQ